MFNITENHFILKSYIEKNSNKIECDDSSLNSEISSTSINSDEMIFNIEISDEDYPKKGKKKIKKYVKKIKKESLDESTNSSCSGMWKFY